MVFGLTSSAAANSTGQLTPLPPVTRHITTHNETTGKAIMHSSGPIQWTPFQGHPDRFGVPYTTSQWPVNMTGEKDIKQYEDVMKSDDLGLVNPGGTVLRFVNLAPDDGPYMHRTVSLDYAVVTEGDVELELDSGEKKIVKRGDVVVQRGTKHSWRSASQDEWARILFVLMSSDNVEVGGKKLEQELPSDSGTD